ncbi:UDP-glucuronosyltransferase 2B18-like [Aedes aegypti]|uniref:UDP-glucuronosyltransferase n=1 Tax=Aedes aegypti TaxID=7159 RepID=A0A6I8T865_AEDAE|nr:UDP-glucuronosyltransferase 2B18 [Aedes aegypti]XP_021699605.1 UDP-glucuronosyltransferase 2B18-like [Aedes aegypti]
MKNQIFILVLTFIPAFVSGANILILSGVPSPSHSIWLRPLMNGLAERGHNVTVVSPDIEKNPPKNVTYIHLENIYDEMYNTSNRQMLDFFEMHKSPMSILRMLDEFTIVCCKAGIKSKGFKQLMSYPENFKFDLFMSDYMFGPCFASLLMYRFGNPPYIPVAPYNALATSAPLIGSYAYSGSIPNHSYDVQESMNFWERLQNWYYDLYEIIMKDIYLYPESDAILKQVFPNAPRTKDLQSSIRLLFINNNPLIQYKEPQMPNVIPVGGMQIRKAKPLPEDLDRIVRSAKNGFILFSLGSNARSDTLGPDRIREILIAMKALPQYQFIWKFESDESKLPMKVPENVFIRAWMPQNDLLAHPNIKLFITHSGLLSTQEAIWNGVPIIGFPLFADQFRNINYCVSLGVAKRLMVQYLQADDLIAAIKDILNTRSYSENIKRLSQLFRDQPESPLERAIWWVEWVLRNPDSEMLQPSAVNVHWIQKYMYDVLLFVITSVILILFIIFKIVTKMLAQLQLNIKVKQS